VTLVDSMCEARFALSSIAKPRAISPPPRPSRDFVCPLASGSSFSRLRDLGGYLLR
jgi:hypothetical protein